MKPRKLPLSPRRATFSDLSDFIRATLKEHKNVRAVSRSDFDQLVVLEREIFPNTPGLFDVPCIRHAVHYFNYAILVGKTSEMIESYFSFFPLTQKGFDYCINEDVKTICHFPVGLLRQQRQYINSIFIEVIATRPMCPYEIKRDTITIFLSLLEEYSYLPFLSCPVSDDGLRILTKFGFEPIKASGLNKLYLRSSHGRK